MRIIFLIILFVSGLVGGELATQAQQSTKGKLHEQARAEAVEKGRLALPSEILRKLHAEKNRMGVSPSQKRDKFKSIEAEALKEKGLDPKCYSMDVETEKFVETCVVTGATDEKHTP